MFHITLSLNPISGPHWIKQYVFYILLVYWKEHTNIALYFASYSCSFTQFLSLHFGISTLFSTLETLKLGAVPSRCPSFGNLSFSWVVFFFSNLVVYYYHLTPFSHRYWHSNSLVPGPLPGARRCSGETHGIEKINPKPEKGVLSLSPSEKHMFCNLRWREPRREVVPRG